MWGGIWYGGLTYGGTDFTSFGAFDPSIILDPCYTLALGYAGAWYAGLVYGGTPFCLTVFSDFQPVPPGSNVLNLCIVRC